MNFLEFHYLDKDSIDDYEARASYLLDAAQEYDLDNPEFAKKLREFRNEKVKRINELIHEILEEVNEMENYTSHIER